MLIIIYAFFIALLGAVAHWVKKYTRNQTYDNLLQHFQDNWMHSLGVIASLFGAVVGIVAIGIDLTEGKDIATLILAGYSADSLFNKNTDQ